MTIRTVAVAAALLAAAAAEAQSIKGTVVDDATKAPVGGVLITMVDGAGTEVGRGVRSDSAGGFVVHAPRAGTWRVRTMRIGYEPLVGPPVELGVGGLAVVRLRLTLVAQPLAPVQIVERRRYNAGELMSTMGFDLRRERGEGAFLSGERLAAMGLDGAREVLGIFFQPRLFVYNDPVVGDVLRMREGGRLCAPEIYLDGRLLATTPEPGAYIDSTPAQTALDSLRAQMRADAEYARLAFPQVTALNALSAFTAAELHGIEVYRANEVPPSSLGAWFGMTKASVKPCGTLAVWTKKGALSVVNAVKPNSKTTSPVQVIIGTLVDNESGEPLAGRRVWLLTESRDEIGRAATTDRDGEFVFRTGRSGELRLRAGDSSYRETTSPTITVGPNELVAVRFFVSEKQGLLAPLGIAGRVQPNQVGATSRAGFTYRRARAQGGHFITAADLVLANPASLPEALRGVDGIELTPAADGSTVIRFRPAGARSSCEPALYYDGIPLASAATSTIAMQRLLGIEVYLRPADVPMMFSTGSGCGMIAVWSRPG